MPNKSRRVSLSVNAAQQRWSNDICVSSDDSFSMGIGDEIGNDVAHMNFRDMIQIDDIAEVFEFCKDKCNIRYLSELTYPTLRHLSVSYQETCAFLRYVGDLSGRTAYKECNFFLYGGFDEFVDDGRGGKPGDSLYDVYPELEVEARAFSVPQCQQKTASFTAYDLAQFIDKCYHQITNHNKTDSNLVRLVESCRLDLRIWGALRKEYKPCLLPRTRSFWRRVTPSSVYSPFLNQ